MKYIVTLLFCGLLLQSGCGGTPTSASGGTPGSLIAGETLVPDFEIKIYEAGSTVPLGLGTTGNDGKFQLVRPKGEGPLWLSPGEYAFTLESHEHASASTLPEAMKQLNEHAKTISKAFLAKTPDDAHDALNKVGDLLESIPALASHLSEEKKSVVKKSAKELFECFGALDETMHGGPDTPFLKVADRITAAMAELRSASESL